MRAIFRHFYGLAGITAVHLTRLKWTQKTFDRAFKELSIDIQKSSLRIKFNEPIPINLGLQNGKIWKTASGMQMSRERAVRKYANELEMSSK